MNRPTKLTFHARERLKERTGIADYQNVEKSLIEATRLSKRQIKTRGIRNPDNSDIWMLRYREHILYLPVGVKGLVLTVITKMFCERKGLPPSEPLRSEHGVT
jgi:hypothetical protein